MPIYEYKCDQCGHVSEVLQKVEDPPMTVCVNCGGRVRKLISPPAIQFKGNGWYITDYAKKNTADTGAAPSEAAPKPEKDSPAAKDPKKTAPKPAEKS